MAVMCEDAPEVDLDGMALVDMKPQQNVESGYVAEDQDDDADRIMYEIKFCPLPTKCSDASWGKTYKCRSYKGENVSRCYMMWHLVEGKHQLAMEDARELATKCRIVSCTESAQDRAEYRDQCHSATKRRAEEKEQQRNNGKRRDNRKGNGDRDQSAAVAALDDKMNAVMSKIDNMQHMQPDHCSDGRPMGTGSASSWDSIGEPAAGAL